MAEKGAAAIAKQARALETLQIEYVPIGSIQPNEYNPNRQNPRDFDLLLRSMKADGFCVASETPVLCGDLVWRPAGELRVGDELVGFSGEPDPSRHPKDRRLFETATVTSNSLRSDDLLLVETASGPVFCNAEHPWLAFHGAPTTVAGRILRWVPARDLVPGDRVLRLFTPWTTEQSYEAGWLAGMMDGEGSLAVSGAPGKRGDKQFRLAVYQRPGATADRVAAEMQQRSSHVAVSTHLRTSSNPKWSDMQMARVDALADVMAMLGSVRPERLLALGRHLWEGRSIAGVGEYIEVLAVEPAGRGEIASLSTSTHTYIAAGYAMHNTQPVIVQRSTNQIVDGEHRWRAGREMGYKEIPVVFVDMTDEQMRISTLRHNRARGSEDFELASAMIRDLRELGALDWAKEELMLDDKELERLLDDSPVTETMSGEEFSQAWEPAGEFERQPTVEATELNEENQPGIKQPLMMAATPDAAARIAQAEAAIAAARGPARYELQRQRDLYKLSLLFNDDEAEVVKAALGGVPAVRLLELCRAWEQNHPEEVPGTPEFAAQHGIELETPMPTA